MSQPEKPSSTENAKSKETQQPANKALPEAELEKVSGGAPSGQVTMQDIHFTKVVDKSSTSL